MANGMGLETALTSLSLGALQPWRPITQSKWRNRFLASEKNFSRTQTVIQAIHTIVEKANETLDTVINSFETPYEVDAKLSMGKMATIVQHFGIMTRKK
jgi:hypothetical protein